MYYTIDYKRDKDENVSCSKIAESLKTWINKLETQYKTRDKTGLVNKIFRFSEIKTIIDKWGKDGIKSRLTYKDQNLLQRNIVNTFLRTYESMSNNLILKEAKKLKESKLKNLSIEEINKNIKNKDKSAEEFLSKQNEIFDRAGIEVSENIEKDFFDNFDNISDIINEFCHGITSDKSSDRIDRDITLLYDENKSFDKYLKARKEVKDFLKSIKSKLSEMYEYMADKNKSLKSHYNSKKLDPESFFRNIENDIRKTKTSVDYDMLINIIENAKSYLPIFSNIVVNYYSGLNNNDEKLKNQYKEELESKEGQLLNLSKLLEVKSNELKNHG